VPKITLLTAAAHISICSDEQSLSNSEIKLLFIKLFTFIFKIIYICCHSFISKLYQNRKFR